MNKAQAIKKLKVMGISSDVVDWKSYSKDIPIEEWLENEYALIVKPELNPRVEKEALELDKSRRILEEEERAKKEFQEKISILNIPLVEKHFKVTKSYVKMVAKGFNNSVIIKSRGGLGKTFTVLKTLREENIPFEYLNTYSTPLSLYEYIYKNKEKVIVMDDMENIFNNRTAISILKACLWGNPERKVTYLSTSTKLKVPSQFIFNGRIIFLINSFGSINEELNAVKSRTLYQEIHFSFNEVCEIIKNIASIPYKDLNDRERRLVCTYLLNHITPACNIDLRLLIKALDIYKYGRDTKQKWRALVKGIIEKDNELDIIYNLSQEMMSETERVIKWKEATGKGKSTYFKKKKEMNL